MKHIETVIQQFLSSIGYNEPVLIKKNYDSKTVTIYCCHPGWLIGKYGQDIERLEKEIQEATSCFNKVALVETDEYILSNQDWDKTWYDRAKARLDMYK